MNDLQRIEAAADAALIEPLTPEEEAELAAIAPIDRTENARTAARKTYVGLVNAGDVEIDQDAEVIFNEDGDAWVKAWVLTSKDTIDAVAA